jgi:tetratricopeptide (TPR) repeat protein
MADDADEARMPVRLRMLTAWGSADMADTTLREEIQAAEREIAAGHPEAALERCQQLQSRFPRALVIQRVLGEVYLAQRKAREALAVLERALEGDPEDARACCARALVHQIHGDSSAALAWYRRACDIRPEDTLLRDAYGELASHLNQPPYRPTSFGLARLYVRGALFTHAEREWQAILAEQPDRLDAQVGLAETLWRAGDEKRALELGRRIVANTGTCVQALLIVSALEHGRGNDDEARRLLARAAELDPERRIGLALYSDRFASGDLALHTLLMGQEGGSAPGLDDLPTARVPAAMVPRVPDDTATSRASAELEEFSAFAQSRTTQIPANFHQIFAETEFMLWGKDEDAPPAISGERAPKAEPPDPMQRSRARRPERAAHSGSLPANPGDGEPTDTDARMSAGWVRWLQALGAQPLDGGERATQTPPGTGPLSANPPVPDGTGPLSSEQNSLRTMFAELDARRGQPAPGPGSGALDLATFAANGAREPGVGPTVPSRNPPAGLPSVTTIEELQQQFAASGFAQVELRPGTLAAAARTAPPAPSAREAERPTEPPPVAAAPMPEPSAPEVPTGPPVWGESIPTAHKADDQQDTGAAESESAGDDYMTVLRRARRRRTEGRNEEALLDYRAILRDSPDTLDDLIHDLRDMSATAQDPEVHRLLADAYIREGNYTDAIEAYNRAHGLTQSQQG